MKKILSVFLALLLCLSLTISVSATPTTYIVDEFDLLGSAEEDRLNALAGEILEDTGVGIFYVYTYMETLSDYPVSQLVGGLEDFVIMLENETSWYTIYGGRGMEIDEDEEGILRDIYDETDTYVAGVEAFLKAAGAHFPPVEEGPVVISPAPGATTPTTDVTTQGEILLMDSAGILSEAQAKTLNEKLNVVSRKHNAQINIVTIASMADGDIDGFLEYLYDNMEMGYGASHDGVLLLVCMDPREFRILSNGMAGDAISTDAISQITDHITPDLSDGDYAAAFEKFIDRCDYYIDGHLNGFPFDLTGNLATALIIGIIAGLVVAFALKGQLKTVRMQRMAHNYVKPGSMRLTVEHDLFLYRTVKRVRKQSSSSSSSGSSRNTGGGSF